MELENQKEIESGIVTNLGFLPTDNQASTIGLFCQFLFS